MKAPNDPAPAGEKIKQLRTTPALGLKISLIQLPFSMLSVNCDSYKVAIIWAIITTEFEGSLNRKLGS